MTRKPVLMLTPYLPYPPVSGGRSRTYNLVKHLYHDYEITLVCFGRPEERAFDYSVLAAYCEPLVVDRDSSPGPLQAALMSLTSLRPITMRIYSNQAMRETVQQVIQQQQPVIVHVESFYMLQNIPENLDVPVLLSEPAIEYIVWRKHAQVATPSYTRPGVAIEAAKMRRWEPRVWEQANLVGAMSEADAKIIKQATPKANVVLTPNGVDVDYFYVDERVQRSSHTAMYMGDYKYFPNTDAVVYFVEDIMPRIKAKRPSFHLTLVGKDPTPAMLALAGDDVTVTGLVEDARPYLQESAVFVCALRSGSGTRFKLMEALASGCPVVSTSLGCEGLEAVDGEHMLIRDDPQAFADAVLELLDNPDRGSAMGQAGREWVVHKHAWEHSAGLVRQAYEQIILGRNG